VLIRSRALVKFESDDYRVRVAKNIEEDKELIEDSFGFAPTWVFSKSIESESKNWRVSA